MRARLSLLLLLAACDESGGPAALQARYDYALPANFPRPLEPEDNPTTPEKVELGRHLFYDERLSVNETISCASCHEQALSFTDGRARSPGATGELTARNSMSLANAGYAATLTWPSPVLRTLEEQALIPLFGEHPVELGMGGKEDLLLQRLRDEPRYQKLFFAAFGDEADPFTVANVTRALGAFQRTLISGDSPWDRYLRGDESALSESAKRGRDLFFSERFECFHCHSGFNLSVSVQHEGQAFDQALFENNGLYNVDGGGSYPPDNEGLYEFTKTFRDMGRFKPPSLRNVELTAPYMHDGSIETLEEVIAMYERGGRLIEEGPLAGDGAENPYKSDFIRGFVATEQEREDLLAYLRSFTDETFLQNPRFSDPWPHPLRMPGEE